ncbi:hypothetical protein [Dyella sp.]|uniref:hypothetical protein n=1 Tax=Dyella sp. TaxID=1869338 RepID=UPI00284A428D|nr:hypothetical protein [Dyella sp.]MDR3445744.1 hypothetical protein [Dyella sp.]
MSNPIDMAQAFDQLNLEQGLQAQKARAAATRRPTAVGHCLSPDCDAPAFDNPQRLFCGPACERDYSRHKPH